MNEYMIKLVNVLWLKFTWTHIRACLFIFNAANLLEKYSFNWLQYIWSNFVHILMHNDGNNWHLYMIFIMIQICEKESTIWKTSAFSKVYTVKCKGKDEFALLLWKKTAQYVWNKLKYYESNCLLKQISAWNVPIINIKLWLQTVQCTQLSHSHSLVFTVTFKWKNIVQIEIKFKIVAQNHHCTCRIAPAHIWKIIKKMIPPHKNQSKTVSRRIAVKLNEKKDEHIVCYALSTIPS